MGLLAATIASRHIPTGGGGSDPYYAQRVIGLHFDGTNGSTTFVDNSPTPKTVTAVGAAALTTTNPKFGTAALGNAGGTNSRANIAANSAWAFGTNNFTIALWCRTASINGLLIGQFTNTAGAWALYYGGATLVYASRYANTNVFNRAVTLFNNGWNHVAVTRSGTTATLYINGVQNGATATDAANYGASGIDLYIGEQWNGALDDVLIYNGVALNSTEIGALVTATFPDT